MIKHFILVFVVLFFSLSDVFSQEIQEEIIEEEIIEEVVFEESSIAVPSKFSWEISGNIQGDYRYFEKKGLYPGQETEYFSSIFNPQIYVEWDNSNQLIQFEGFARLNQYDIEQTHWDIRELYYQKIIANWELSVGKKQIYWGFTESNHLVNVINQDDLLEGNGVANKLGQSMIHVSNYSEIGTVDVMLMRGFNPIQFPGAKGRLRPPFDVDYASTTYESEDGLDNTDFAIRWSHTISAIDFGVSHFKGNSRTPFFTSNDGVSFAPNYELIDQTGLELQASLGSMLWKVEAIQRKSDRKTIRAYTFGGEYTLVTGRGYDIGFLAEYNYDDRGAESITGLNDDVFVGLRIALNDEQSTSFLGGMNKDNENGTISYFAEANRRLGDSWKINVKAFGFKDVAENEFLYLLRKDGFVELSLIKYF